MLPNKQDNNTKIEKVKLMLGPVTTVSISRINNKKVKNKEV